MKIPDNVQYNFRHFKQGTPFQCSDCGLQEEHFTYLKFKDDNIYYLFNCNGCGNDSFVELSYDELRQLYFADQGNTFWALFTLGSWYDEVFKHASDKSSYVQIIKKINKDTTGWRDYWFRRKYAKH